MEAAAGASPQLPGCPGACVQYDQCAPYAAFITADKPVFHAEYSLTRAQFCPRAERLGLSSIRKRRSLRVWRRAC
jgi:hypothetical protein